MTPVGEDPNGILYALAMDADGNILVNVNGGTIVIPHALLDGTQDNDTVTGAPIAGDIIAGIVQGGGGIKWQRFPMGAALQVLRVNAGGTALEYGTVTGGYTQGCRCTNSANQSIPDNSQTPITFDTEVYDTDTIHDLVTNPSRFTCHTKGIYVCIGGVTFAANATAARTASIAKNGSLIAVSQLISAGASPNTSPNVSGIIDLDIGDYVELWAYQHSTVALNSLALASYAPSMAIQRVG
jgi:hypothetical protein